MSFPDRLACKRAASNLLVASLAAVALAGCSYRVAHEENPVKMPVAWDFQDTAVDAAQIDKEWWRNFGSPVLNELIAQALKDNPGIIATEERLKQAERTFQQNRDALLPELRLSASTSATRSGGNQIPESTRESTSVGLSSSYTVDIFGGQAARFRTQVAQFIGTKYDTELARITLSAQVARAYFNLLGVRSRLAVSRESLAIAERLLAIAQVRRDNGVLREFDLRQQETQVLSQRASLIQLENQTRQAETALGILLGRTPQEFRIEGEPIEQLTVPEIAPWVPSEMLSRRADMAGAELDMAVARANVAVARASLIPVTLSLSANGNTSSQELLTLTDARTWSLQGALSIAEGIFSFKQRRNSVLNAESNEYIALINYAQTIRTALKEIDDTLATANVNRRTEEVQRQTVDNARRSLELIEAENREGSATQQEVRDAQRSLFSAEDSLAQARLTRLNTAVQLYQALGGGWEAPPTLQP